MDAGHVVPLLFARAQLETGVEAGDAAIETGAVVPRRIEPFDSERRRARDAPEPGRDNRVARAAGGG